VSVVSVRLDIITAGHDAGHRADDQHEHGAAKDQHGCQSGVWAKQGGWMPSAGVSRTVTVANAAATCNASEAITSCYTINSFGAGSLVSISGKSCYNGGNGWFIATCVQ